uniref:Cdkn1a interacting zinc finger protein 1b n=1 Tax=Pygocentrus nattereri TaxID=42514 RepID=A0A3B4D3T0_PYGNA
MTKSKADIITSQKGELICLCGGDVFCSNRLICVLIQLFIHPFIHPSIFVANHVIIGLRCVHSVLFDIEKKMEMSIKDGQALQYLGMQVQGVGTSLKVTIQRSSDSRAFSTGLEESPAAAGQSTDKEKSESAGELCCKICNVTCPDQQDFQTHMISLDHQMRMMEIQHLSNTCLATLLPQIQQTLQGTLRDKKQGPRWCAFCQCHFSGDLIEHRRTKKHKMAKVSSRPFCTVCERHFRTPRKFVEHMKSPEHKQRVEELREEGGPEVMEELITVDAVGCFEGEDDYEEEGNEDEEDTVTEQLVLSEEINDCNDYDPDTQYGTSFVVPVAGFLCKLCHKFYHFESKAREAHCKSLMHYQNLQVTKTFVHGSDMHKQWFFLLRLIPTVSNPCPKSSGTQNPAVVRKHHSCKMTSDSGSTIQKKNYNTKEKL